MLQTISWLLYGAGIAAIPVLIGILLRGWALSTLWGWFIVPTFGLPSLSLLTAIGVMLVSSVLTYHPYIPRCGNKAKEKKGAELQQDNLVWEFFLLLGSFVIVPLSALCIGYIVHSSM